MLSRESDANDCLLDAPGRDHARSLTVWIGFQLPCLIHPSNFLGVMPFAPLPYPYVLDPWLSTEYHVDTPATLHKKCFAHKKISFATEIVLTVASEERGIIVYSLRIIAKHFLLYAFME